MLCGALAGGMLSLYDAWREASNNGGQKAAEPFRIADNLYYVGANDTTSFLLTAPEGHILIDGGYPGTPSLILASIEKLGFDINDVKLILNTHPHLDHAGGLAELQKVSGAELWVSDNDAEIMEAGGAGSRFLGPLEFVSYLPVFRFTPPRVDERFSDRESVNVGSTELIANVTAGHTPGCTSWSFKVRDGERVLDVVLICGLTPPLSLSMGEYPEIRKDFEKSFKRLRSLKADIFLTPHARDFGRWPKYQNSLEAKNPVDAFIDPEGYRKYIDEHEKRYRDAIGN